MLHHQSYSAKVSVTVIRLTPRYRYLLYLYIFKISRQPHLTSSSLVRSKFPGGRLHPFKKCIRLKKQSDQQWPHRDLAPPLATDRTSLSPTWPLRMRAIEAPDHRIMRDAFVSLFKSSSERCVQFLNSNMEPKDGDKNVWFKEQSVKLVTGGTQ